MKATRKHKINKLFMTIKDHEDGIEKEKLIASVCYVLGTARRTILEYLRVLMETSKIILEDGKYKPSREKQTDL